jgi:hypothetical protein
MEESAAIKSWQQGRYELRGFLDTTPPLEIVIGRKSQAVGIEMERESIRFLGYLAMLLALGILLSRFLSRLLTVPIWRLSTLLNSSTNGIVTTDLKVQA